MVLLDETGCQYADALVVVRLSSLTHDLIDLTVADKKGRS
jgi:hypothetical protein